MNDRGPRSISVIVPTYNRASALVWCLEHLEAQTYRDFDVIVVDDGSIDCTSDAVASYQSKSSLDLRYISQKNAGPGRARNRAVQLTHSPLCLFLGDDILASPQLIQRHVEFHREHPESATCGLGLTRWDRERQELTAFMKYFEQVQFAYSDLIAGTQPDYRHFYTSNLSVKTALLRQYAFDERFPKAAMEDVELAYRVTQTEKLRIGFLPKAVAFHYHPTSLRQACRRNISIGWSIHLFEELWPEARPFIPPLSGWKKILGWVLEQPAIQSALTSLLGSLERIYCNARLTRLVLDSYQRLGYQEREKEVGLLSGG